MKKINKTDEQWQSDLTLEEYQILRKEGTERSFSHPFNREHRKGTFVCAGCDTPLFTSDMKFDSGTGWPSFFNHIEDAFVTKVDKKLFMSQIGRAHV